MNNFKTRFALLKKEYKLTYSQIGRTIGKSEVCIRSWESGRTKPHVDEIIALSSLFDVSTDYLLGISKVRKPMLKEFYVRNRRLEGIIKTYYEDEHLGTSRKNCIDLLSDILDCREHPNLQPFFLRFLEELDRFLSFDKSNKDEFEKVKKSIPFVDPKGMTPEELLDFLQMRVGSAIDTMAHQLKYGSQLMPSHRKVHLSCPTPDEIKKIHESMPDPSEENF
jgi:transcriptional regulator with XRE-family HTH domain